MSEINDTNEIQWITMNGNHIPIKPGQSKDDAIDAFISNKSKTKKYGFIYIGGRKMLVDMDAYNGASNYNQAEIVELNEEEIKDTIKQTIGDISDYNWEEETDYGAINEQIRQKLKEEGLSAEIARSRVVENWMRDEFNKIREYKADQFLKTLPKLENKDLTNITRGSNLANFLKSRYVNYDHKYTWNCQRCVQAWFLRHLGYDVEAMPYDGEKQYWGFKIGSSNAKIDDYGWDYAIFNRSELTKSFEGKDKQWASSQLKEMTKIAQNDGNGACYFVQVAWRGGADGHVFVCYNDNGDIKFIDPQDDSDASHYFDPRYGYTLITKETKMVRVDKAKLNGEVMKYVVKKNDSEINEGFDQTYKEHLVKNAKWSKEEYERNLERQKENREWRKKGWRII